MDQFDETTKNQVRVAGFLNSLEPILNPLDGFSKFGISLASAFAGFSATIVAALVSRESFNLKPSPILFLSWALFLASISFGALQLWRGLKFRVGLRIFAYSLFGDTVDQKTKTEVHRHSKSSMWGWLIAQFWALIIGIFCLVLWAYMQLA